MSSPPTSRRRDRRRLNWDLDALWTALKTLYPVGSPRLADPQGHDSGATITREELLEALLRTPGVPYACTGGELEIAGRVRVRQLERNVLARHRP